MRSIGSPLEPLRMRASRDPRMEPDMVAKAAPDLVDGASCRVVAGTHAGKAGVVRDINTSKTGHVTITVEQDGGARFKTLAKNVVVTKGREKGDTRPLKG